MGAGRPKGQPKTGGRQKGTVNKDKQSLLDTCARLGVDIFEGMVIMASEELDPDKRFNKFERVANFIYPKPKAVELSTPEDAGLKLIVEDYTK